MKVLFAVNNDKISESVIKKYQANYKEIISAKNVYYFNAIIKELQRDKSYDRIVISEDLEPFSNKNYDAMDRFLFDKLDSISDEASNSEEGEIPIVLICTDRREKGEPILLKMFSIGVYSALIGNDRTIENVCQLINKPRNKKEAKAYYNIDSEGADYQSEKAEDVSEVEIQNIINHYKRLGKNEDKYVESFNSIAAQYTEGQLKVIVRFLPLNVRAVLEEKCEKYKQLMVGSVRGKVRENKAVVTKNIKTTKTNHGPKIDLIEQQLNRPKMTKNVVIPSTVDVNKVKKVYKDPNPIPAIVKEEKTDVANDIDRILSSVPENNENIPEKAEVVEPVKRGRGRPAKPKAEIQEEPVEKKRRGRPRKIVETPTPEVEEVKPIVEEPTESVNLFDLGNDEVEERDFASNDTSNNADIFPEDDSAVLPGLEEDNDDIFETKPKEVVNNSRSDININYNTANNRDNSTTIKNPEVEPWQDNNSFSRNNINETSIRNTQYTEPANLSNLLTSDKKIVAFVGTSKNGTSFLVNNLAAMLSAKGINTAILDLTKNKNAYYIYTQNDENLRNQAFRCIEELRMGNANGINVNKNLTVYTTLPNEDSGIEDYGKVLETLAKNYSLVLMDCDFDTDYNYFASSQEIYLVQTYDILTIQPLTAFLKELADRNILDQNKLRVVINKALKVRSLTEKMIVGGISSYNDPAMSYMKNLFNKDTMKYITIPFEDQTYAKYLEGLVTCEISLNGYSKGLLESLARLGDMVYPLISGKKQYGSRPNYNNYNDYNRKNNASQFNSSIDSTLDKMRRNY